MNGRSGSRRLVLAHRLVAQPLGQREVHGFLHPRHAAHAERAQRIVARDDRPRTLDIAGDGAGPAHEIAEAGNVVLATEGNLLPRPMFAEGAALIANISSTNDYAVLLDLAGRIDGRFRALMEAHVPPLDLRTYTMSRGPISTRRRDSRVDQAAQVSQSNHLNARAKWRYPI